MTEFFKLVFYGDCPSFEDLMKREYQTHVEDCIRCFHRVQLQRDLDFIDKMLEEPLDKQEEVC